MRRFQVGEVHVGTRLDIFLAEQYPQFSRSALEILFDKHLVRHKGEPARPSQKLKENDTIEVDEHLLKAEPPPMSLPVLYEDDDVMVIDKPSGLLTHSKGALSLEPTVASFIRPQLKDKELSGNRAGIVHRLDRPTSGVIITAKTAAAQRWLQQQFSSRKVKKTYLAVVEGDLEPPAALIDAPIGRNPSKPQTFMVSADGRTAQTEYEVIERYETKHGINSKILLRPLTGRTHQLRVHLAYIKHPIIGDKLYGHDGPDLLLHAYRLELTLPSRERRVFEAAIPDKLDGSDG